MPMRTFFAELARDTRGSTIVEFAIIAMPMCLLLLGGLDLAYQSYVRSVMQGALNDAARKAAVETPSFSSSGASIEEKVANSIKDITNKIAIDATIDVSQKSYFDFSNVGNPEALMTDNNSNGRYDDDEGDCFEDANRNGTFDEDQGSSNRGGANDVVFYTAEISMPRLLPWHSFANVSPTIDMQVKTAVRSQPYANQVTAPVVCGVVS